MKKLTRKLLISMFAVIFAAVAMVTSAYAWFTIGGTVTASAFNADVTAGEGVEISLDDESWYNSISSAAMNTHLAKAYLTASSGTYTSQADLTAAGFSLKDLTSADGTTIVKMDGTTAAAFTGGYVSFTLYFRSPTAGTVTLDKETVIKSTGIEWMADATVTNPQAGTEYAAGITAGTAQEFYASNAIRMYVGTAANHVIVGRENVNDGADNTTKSFGLAIAEATSANPITSFVTAYAKEKGASVSVPASFTLPTADTLAEDKTICTLSRTGDTGWFLGTVTVNIWVEGYDADCINAILGDTISISLAFSKVAA